MPLPQELIELWRIMATDRTDGPLFRTRADWNGQKRRRLSFASADEFAALCQKEIGQARADDVATEQDRKALIRQLLRKCGAITTDGISRELRQLFSAAGLREPLRPYDVRAAVTTDMHDAGLRHLEMRYLTEHSVNDILNEYTSLKPVEEMEKYFQHIEPLLAAVRRRAVELRILNS
jgi:site-specific recombinase XerD